MSRIFSFASTFFAVLVAGAAHGHGTLGGKDPGAPAHLVLVKSCAAFGWSSTTPPRCFETIAALNTGIWDTGGILPTAANPLTVDIGPGEFLGTISCPNGGGHVTFRGAGRDLTIIKSNSAAPFAAVVANSCVALGFQDLKLVAIDPSAGSEAHAVSWTGGGSSSWSDVDLEGEGTGWYDEECGGSPTDLPSGTHYFFGSTIRGGRVGFYAECSDSWFYGGEIAANASILGATSSAMVGVWVTNRAEFHAFGSAVRVSTAPLTSGSGTAYGARVGPDEAGAPNGYGEFHSHGGVVSIDSSTTPAVAAIGVSLDNNTGSSTGTAKAHTLETAFAIKGGASKKRLSGTGSFESPHVWEARTDPPPAGGEIDGQEMYVETDCNALNCTNGSDPHLMIYTTNALCTTHWFDLVRRACRVN